MPPQYGGEKQAHIGADGGGEKSVDIRQNRGLLRDGGPHEPWGASLETTRYGRNRPRHMTTINRVEVTQIAFALDP
jgi:hypothetical protein